VAAGKLGYLKPSFDIASILGHPMNVLDDPYAWGVEKFAIGQPVPRTEDPKLVQGQGRYTDDVNLPGEAFAVMVRSRHAHGRIRQIDVAAARQMPGVLAVYTNAEINAAGYGPLKTVMPLKNRDGTMMKVPTRFALAGDKVRFVGDPVACVVAETVAQGKDAAEQTTITMRKIEAALKKAGCKLSDLTQMTIFVTDIRDMGAVSKALGKALKGSVVTSTLVAVSALAVPGLVVEIESMGVVGS